MKQMVRLLQNRGLRESPRNGETKSNVVRAEVRCIVGTLSDLAKPVQVAKTAATNNTIGEGRIAIKATAQLIKAPLSDVPSTS